MFGMVMLAIHLTNSDLRPATGFSPPACSPHDFWPNELRLLPAPQAGDGIGSSVCYGITFARDLPKRLKKEPVATPARLTPSPTETPALAVA